MAAFKRNCTQHPTVVYGNDFLWDISDKINMPKVSLLLFCFLCTFCRSIQVVQVCNLMQFCLPIQIKTPFRRVKEEEITVDPRLKDNSFEGKVRRVSLLGNAKHGSSELSLRVITHSNCFNLAVTLGKTNCCKKYSTSADVQVLQKYM